MSGVPAVQFYILNEKFLKGEMKILSKEQSSNQRNEDGRKGGKHKSLRNKIQKEQSPIPLASRTESTSPIIGENLQKRHRSPEIRHSHCKKSRNDGTLNLIIFFKFLNNLHYFKYVLCSTLG